MKILALEFSSRQRSAALIDASASGSGTFAVSEEQGRGAGISLVAECMRRAGVLPAELNVIAVGIGPGSYTGMRSAISIAQGMQLAHETPILGIGAMEILAGGAAEQGIRGEVTFVIDAQRGEVYAAAYRIEGGRSTVLEPLAIRSPEGLVGRAVYGPDASRLITGGTDFFPAAEVLAKLARDRKDFVRGEQLEPIYLRPAAFVKAKK